MTNIYEDEDGGDVNTTEEIAPFYGRVGEVQRRVPRKYKYNNMRNKIKDKDKIMKIEIHQHEPFSTFEIRELSTLKENVYENDKMLIPIEGDYNYKLINIDGYRNVYENEVIVDRRSGDIFIEINKEETFQSLVREGGIRKIMENTNNKEVSNLFYFYKSIYEGYILGYIYKNEKYTKLIKE